MREMRAVRQACMCSEGDLRTSVPTEAELRLSTHNTDLEGTSSISDSGTVIDLEATYHGW